VEIAFFESLGSSALNRKKLAYDRIAEDAVAHLGLPALKAHAVALGHLIKKEQLENSFRTLRIRLIGIRGAAPNGIVNRIFLCDLSVKNPLYRPRRRTHLES